jgi:hypothetical protein
MRYQLTDQDRRIKDHRYRRALLDTHADAEVEEN